MEKPNSGCLICGKKYYRMCKNLCVSCYNKVRYQKIKEQKHRYYIRNREKLSLQNKQRHYAKRNTEYAEVKKYTDAQLMALKPMNTTPDPFSIVSEIEALGLQDFV